MVLIKTIDIDQKSRLYVWDVQEPLATLQEGVSLTPQQNEMFRTIHNEKGKKNFLTARFLLKNLGYPPNVLFYDPNGKPFPSDSRQISISHSFDKVAVIVSNRGVGVDIEKKRDKIVRIAPKYAQWDYRTAAFSFENIVQKLIMIWCAKEVGFKVHGNSALMLNSIKVRGFFPTDTRTEIKVEKTVYGVFFHFISDFVLSYCLHIK